MDAFPQQTADSLAKKTRLFTKPFILIWLSTLCSGLSISMFLFSQTWYIIQVLRQEAALGIVFIAATLPRLAFMLIGGVVADQWSKKGILFASSLLKACLMLVLGAFTWWSHSSLPLFVVFAFLFGTIDAFFWPAQNSIIPSLVSPSSLLRANSILQTTSQTSLLIGPLLAGFIIEWDSYSLLYGSVAMLLFFSSVSVLVISIPKSSVRLFSSQASLLDSIKEGFLYAKQSVFLPRLLTAVICLNLFLMGPLHIGLPLFVKQVLSGTTLQYSFLEGSLAFGMLTGAAVLTVTPQPQNKIHVAFLFMIMQALVFFSFSLTHQLWLSMLVLFTLGLTFSLVNIPILAFVQERVPEVSLGKIMSLLSLASLGLQPISQAMTSLLIAYGFTAKQIIFGASVPLLFASCFFYWRQSRAQSTVQSG
ncbi:MFS transporter [Brevibacillus sp. NRS-1366]|uniref:MFS transporter n=1 Tax=Brevibacillus sp. NRS-1366 TaxID=3233899 RepID=UPI003D1B00A3